MSNDKAFKSKDYREAIQHLFNSKSETNPSLTYTKLAQAMKVQNSYLSKAFALEGHLSSDQIFLALRFLKCRPIEFDFIEALAEHCRSSVEERKADLMSRLDKMRAKEMQSSEHLSKTTKSISAQDHISYYLNAHCLLVHVALLVPRYQENSVAKISKKFSIPQDQVERAVVTLLETGLIERDPKTKSIKPTTMYIHLSPDDPLLWPTIRSCGR
jgi:predicted transcriptional regulator